MEARRTRSDVQELGVAIRRNRTKAGVTQGDLVRQLGINRTTLGKWERSEVFPSPRGIRALRNAGMLGPRKAQGDASDREDVPPNDKRERALVAVFRRISPEQQEAVLRLMDAMKVPSDAGNQAAYQERGKRTGI